MTLYAIERIMEPFGEGVLVRGITLDSTRGIRLYTNREDAQRDARRYAAWARGLASYRVVHAELDGEPGVEFLYDPDTRSLVECAVLQNQDCEMEPEVEEFGGIYWLDPVKWRAKSSGKVAGP